MKSSSSGVEPVNTIGPSIPYCIGMFVRLTRKADFDAYVLVFFGFHLNSAKPLQTEVEYWRDATWKGLWMVTSEFMSLILEWLSTYQGLLARL